MNRVGNKTRKSAAGILSKYAKSSITIEKVGGSLAKYADAEKFGLEKTAWREAVEKC